MKNLFYLLWLLAAPLLMSSCSEDDEVTPNPYSELTSEVVYSKFTNSGYLPKDRPAADMRVYNGDTLRYKFRFETNKGLKDLKVYDNIRGREFPVVGLQHVSTTQDRGVTIAHYALEYIVDNSMVSGLPNFEVVLSVEAEEADGTIYKLPATGKPLEIKFPVSQPLAYQNMKLFNYWGSKSNSLVIQDYRIGLVEKQTLVDEQLTSPFALLTNKMPVRSWFDTRFEAAFSSGEAAGTRFATFVKVPAAAKNWNNPNLIVKGMQQYGPANPEATNVKVGDVYAFRARYPFGDSWVVYGIIEVKKIVDDGGDTTSSTGHDEDYLELDIKYFPGYRY